MCEYKVCKKNMKDTSVCVQEPVLMLEPDADACCCAHCRVCSVYLVVLSAPCRVCSVYLVVLSAPCSAQCTWQCSAHLAVLSAPCSAQCALQCTLYGVLTQCMRILMWLHFFLLCVECFVWRGVVYNLDLS